MLSLKFLPSMLSIKMIGFVYKGDYHIYPIRTPYLLTAFVLKLEQVHFIIYKVMKYRELLMK